MPNLLINEHSPYLQQHAHNPVNWYPWGDEAFTIAAEKNMPVLVSIGYSACHWCHVMERESFEREDTAAYMNAHFVCIKVDREEHPDVDHLYMDAVQAISGSGGWPLNVFVTAERKPFFGGTYFPPKPLYGRPSWMQVLIHMVSIWENSPGEVKEQTTQMGHYLQQMSKDLFPEISAAPDKDTCRQMAENLLKQADNEFGGFGNAPKFPGTMAISFLLEYYYFTGHQPSLQNALKSLDAMANGGIYDQLGGGFARYATDRKWLVPHFEKMLYDNALLVAVYCDAYTITGNGHYKTIIKETLAFAGRELKHSSGGYYCALDADSEGVEGKFYTWTWKEWADVLGNEHDIAAAYFGVTEHGNWEETNILHVNRPVADIAREYQCTDTQVLEKINEAKEKLLAARNNKIRPGTDDKCLLAWNALMNIALCKAGIALHETDYIKEAETHMQWMCEKFETGASLKHVWKNDTARIPAKLDDYAFLIQAQLQLASATGNEDWILAASRLLEDAISKFSHEEGFFYFTSKEQNDIPVRKVELFDGATPSANVVMASNLWICGMCMENTLWAESSEMMLLKMNSTAFRHIYSHGYWALLIQRFVYGQITVICTGTDKEYVANKIRENFAPQAYIIMSKKEKSNIPLLENKNFENKNYTFVCSKTACLPPVEEVEDVLKLIKNHQE